MPANPPRPLLQNPVTGTTIDTNLATLGLNSTSQWKNRVHESADSSQTSLRSLAHQARQKLKIQHSKQPLEVPFDSEMPTDLTVDESSTLREQGGAHSKSPSANPSPLVSDIPFSSSKEQMARDSSTNRPSLTTFKGEGSMRPGTQTLIQALQALPWDDDPDIDNMDERDPMNTSYVTDEEAGQPPAPISSSIHAIYRPIAQSRKNTPATSTLSDANTSYFPGTTVGSPLEIYEEPEDEPDYVSDFENTSNLECTLPIASVFTDDISGQSSKEASISRHRLSVTRSGSLATVRLSRRSRLATMLKEVFELNDINEVIAVLQGYMYLTNSHICFFARIPSREDQILKSGTLHKKTHRTRRWVKRWFVLKNDALSWYQSSSDPYFPHGVVDLRYAISCDSIGEKDFRIRTNEKIISFSSDSVPSRDEWVKAIRKVIFKAQNMGESVKIAIPYPVIVEVERSSVMEFSDTIEVKVLDQEDTYSLDSYFFAYFHDLAAALKQIQDILQAYRLEPRFSDNSAVKDTTIRSMPTATDGSQSDRVQTMPYPETSRLVGSSRFKLNSLLKSLSSGDTLPMSSRTISSPEIINTGPTAPQDTSRAMPPASSMPNVSSTIGSGSTHSSHLSSSSYDHTYPPSPPPSNFTGSWNVSVPSWLKESSLKIFSTSSHTVQKPALPDDPDFAVIDSTSSGRNGIDPDVEMKFRRTFAIDDRVDLLGYTNGYLLRVLPLSGRFYISTNFLCFRSSQPLIKTKVIIPPHTPHTEPEAIQMIIPIRDILSTQKCKAFQFNCYGLVVIIKSHEELFFEFNSAERRELCIDLVEQQIEVLRNKTKLLSNDTMSEKERANLVLKELELPPPSTSGDPRPPPETVTESLPAVMFTSASSTFLDFKPQESLHFTFLTIGSRGDVQPYIALAKGLMNDGHKVKIATHGEYREWIEAHDIGFACVGGDPAELMRICVENGMFTVSFLRETLQKFRGWLDELLNSSWEACKGTDVLIESPSAMGGLHIAEALRIPYFRAFTMPWTRTRVYPHAFAVPDHKMGGGYNYMSYVMFDQVFWRAISGQINRWRRNTLGIGPTSLDRMEQHKVPFLYNFSPAVVPPPLDWYEWIRITGYWFLDDAEVGSTKWMPPSDLLAFIETAHHCGKKVVYIGFGSIVVSNPAAMTQCVVEAIVRSGVYAILSKGWSDRLHVKKSLEDESGGDTLPHQIYQIASIPHDWLFSRIDAACHHGGAGTTGASLKAGIPTIIKPFFGDQFFWGDRVEALGVGSSVKKLTVENLTAALITATTDIKQIDRAKLIGQTIRAETGVQNAIEAIYRDLEYAKTLIKPTVASDDEAATISQARSRTSQREVSPAKSQSIEGSNGSREAPSDDWSLISDEDDGASPSPSLSKRRSIASRPLHALHDALTSGSSTRNSTV